MDEVHDVTKYFTSKFKLLVSYVDHIVGIYEHPQGGHAWEAGYIDRPALRQRARAFYRSYDTQDEQYAAYDGMFAHYPLSMERVDRAHTWTTSEEPRARVETVYGPAYEISRNTIAFRYTRRRCASTPVARPSVRPSSATSFLRSSSGAPRET